MGLTIEQLFQAYEDQSQDFALDIYEWFGGGDEEAAEKFAREHGEYLPVYDPTADNLAFEDKYLAFQNAAAVQNLAERVTESTYDTEMEKVSGGVKKEVGQAREASGQLGLRSGSLESALESTLSTATSDVENLTDRTLLQKEENLNTYNVKMVDSTLDYDKTILENKADFYDRVMSMVLDLAERDVLTGETWTLTEGVEPTRPEDWETDCRQTTTAGGRCTCECWDETEWTHNFGVCGTDC